MLKNASLAAVLGDLNRTATKVSAATVGATGFQRGFAWDTDDEGKAWWIPQGLTGSFDAHATGTAAGKKVVATTSPSIPPPRARRASGCRSPT